MGLRAQGAVHTGHSCCSAAWLLCTKAQGVDRCDPTSTWAALCSECGAGGTLFEPRITAAAASRRHAKWQLAVQRSFALAELTKDLQD